MRKKSQLGQKSKFAGASILLAAGLQSAYAAEPSGEAYDVAGVPFLFSGEKWGVALGGAGVIKGIGQPQASLFGSAIASTNGSELVYLGLQNFIIPGLDQMLVSVNTLYSDYTQSSYYLPGNPDFSGEQPGSNDSSKDNFITTSSVEQSFAARFKYILPIAEGRNGALASLKGDATAGEVWNPLTSGISSFEVQPFYESQELDDHSTDSADKAAGIKFILDYDNRNASQLPTRGSQTTFTYTKDWGSENRADWATWEFEFSKFISLGSSEYLDQQVIALNAWVADTPTWNDTTHVNGAEVYQRPPSFAGISLGGWDKLRGYSTDRFYGRSAVSYSLEFRAIPNWQPLEDLPVIGPLYDIPWWQWTLFVDAGRVADDFDLGELHTDMKYSVGGGIRFKVEGITVRTEIASSKEDNQLRIFINQPF
ncbi:hypothetical protein [Endozoicomonas sp. 4G]|uniref:hypothetical protein n=1 Tax=Endozoicomonas sp. 4G TaxID=2872754 RepID=UPI002078DC37|nr:hypothetical protein [Endozoicomonas sp. 4G]